MSYASPVAAMLVGGLVPSVGFMYLARSARGRALLARTRGRTLAVLAVLVVGACVATIYFVTLRVLGSLHHAGPHRLPYPSTLVFLLFGLVVGLFLAVPPTVLAWVDERSRARARSRRKGHAPTREERRAFAEDLARQIRELSVPRRDVRVRVGGDGDRVLLVEGPLDAQEGEKLTTVLRSDLRELGFKRVEGSGGKRDWWTPV
ncbi:MAG: hypothetical protein LJF06_08855 [Gemmatimonadetes bacterium]|nr:hypothetical protein [Gemmatimonadota bacterium]